MPFGLKVVTAGVGTAILEMGEALNVQGGQISYPAVAGAQATDGGAAPVSDLQAAQAATPNQVGIAQADEDFLGRAMQNRGLTWAQAVAALWPASMPSYLTPSAAVLAAWQPIVTARAAAGWYCR